MKYRFLLDTFSAAITLKTGLQPGPKIKAFIKNWKTSQEAAKFNERFERHLLLCRKIYQESRDALVAKALLLLQNIVWFIHVNEFARHPQGKYIMVAFISRFVPMGMTQKTIKGLLSKLPKGKWLGAEYEQSLNFKKDWQKRGHAVQYAD